RRRHTRLQGDWSSDVCSSDLFTAMGGSVTHESFDDTKTLAGIPVSEGYRDGYVATFNGRLGYHVSPLVYTFIEPSANWARYVSRSEERRVGKGGSGWWWGRAS